MWRTNIQTQRDGGRGITTTEREREGGGVTYNQNHLSTDSIVLIFLLLGLGFADPNCIQLITKPKTKKETNTPPSSPTPTSTPKFC